MALLLASAVASGYFSLPAVASASFSFRGRTSQGRPVSFRVTTSAVVENFVIGWSAGCTSGASLVDGSVAPRTPVHPFPRFHNTGHYMASAVTYSAASGRTLSYAVSVRLNGILPRNAHAHGTWTAKVQVLDTSRNVIDNCTTGLVHWHATLS